MATEDSQLAKDPVSQIGPELSTDETLLWVGRPPRGFIFTWFDAVLIPFLFLYLAGWVGMVIAKFIGVFPKEILKGDPITFLPMLFVVIAIVSYMNYGRFWIDARRRAKTVYGVTDKRVIVVCELFRRSVKSFDILALPSVGLVEKAGGAGLVTLGPVTWGAYLRARSSLPTMKWLGSPALLLSADVRQVYEIIQRVRKQGT